MIWFYFTVIQQITYYLLNNLIVCYKVKYKDYKPLPFMDLRIINFNLRNILLLANITGSHSKKNERESENDEV